MRKNFDVISTFWLQLDENKIGEEKRLNDLQSFAEKMYVRVKVLMTFR